MPTTDMSRTNVRLLLIGLSPTCAGHIRPAPRGLPRLWFSDPKSHDGFLVSVQSLLVETFKR